MRCWEHLLTVLASTRAATLECVAVWLDGGSQCLNVDTQGFPQTCRLLFRALGDRGSLLLIKTVLTMVFCMSGSLPDTTHDKEKLYLSIQARQDQIHPSEDLSILTLPARSDLDSTDGDTVVDIPKPEAKSLLPNGEVQLGSRKERGRDGSWKYTWPDGFTFEGEVSDKMESGKGKITWPSGAMYEGSFLNGCFHGFGTYTQEDGTVYAGNWIMNLKHGYGEKCYANGDDYKGYWSQGKREGTGTYTWKNGNLYLGNWKGDVMCGRGKLTWRNGDTFEGQWADGKEHGRGVYRWVESGCYVGTWSRGLKDGKGTFYPPGTEPPKYRLLLHGSSIGSDVEEEPGNRRRSFGLWRMSSRDSGKMVGQDLHRERQVAASTSSTTNFLRKAESLPTRAVSLERKWSLEMKLMGLEVGSTSSIAGEPILEDDEFKMEETVLPIVEREYAQGVLINEIVKERFPSKRAKRRQKRQSKEIKRPGETIIKGHRSYDLMLNLQLGIRYSVGKTIGPQRDLIPSDFGHRARIWMRFPREGSQLTPPHPSVDFRWKDYCPMVFRKLREMFKIDAADYMMSLCGNAALRELSSPGKSGSIFFLSHDDRYLIKTLRKQELKVLLKMLRNYYNHVCKYENTLITKFFGLHRIKLAGGHKVRFVVMGNVFCTELAIHRRYDLKGSSLGRSTSKIEIDETTTLKDLDLDFTFHLEPTWRESLLQQIEDDCSFLESQQIMDYSLLLGLHRRAPQYAKLSAQQSIIEEDMTTTIDDDEAGAYPEGLVLVTHEPNDRTSGSHIRGSSLRAAVAGDEQVDLLLAGTARLRIQLGVNMPARADRRPDVADTESVLETEDVVLCLGIIDTLQEYNMVKKIEHAYKSLQFDSVSISAVDPHLYSQRFQDCLRNVFPEASY